MLVYCILKYITTSLHKNRGAHQNSIIRIKSGEPGFLGFSVLEWLGGVICKPEGAA